MKQKRVKKTHRKSKLETRTQSAKQSRVRRRRERNGNGVYGVVLIQVHNSEFKRGRLQKATKVGSRVSVSIDDAVYAETECERSELSIQKEEWGLQFR